MNTSAFDRALDQGTFLANQKSFLMSLRVALLTSTSPVLWILQGGPGSGKTHILKYANELPRVYLTATTGAAASLLPNASTRHRFLQQDITGGWKRGSILGCECLVVDEMSMLSVKDILDIDKRLRQTPLPGGSQLYFGGRILLLVGDLLQLPSVAGHNFNLATREGVGFLKALKSSGVDIRITRLESQGRSKCDALSDILLKMRKKSSCADGIRSLIAKVPFLSAADSAFSFAPIVVSRNEDVDAINSAQIRRHSSITGHQLVIWPSKKRKVTSMSL